MSENGTGTIFTFTNEVPSNIVIGDITITPEQIEYKGEVVPDVHGVYNALCKVLNLPNKPNITVEDIAEVIYRCIDPEKECPAISADKAAQEILNLIRRRSE